MLRDDQEANRAAANCLTQSRSFGGKPLTVFITDSERQIFRANLNELQLQQMDWISLLEVSLQPRKYLLMLP